LRFNIRIFQQTSRLSVGFAIWTHCSGFRSNEKTLKNS
jgi:hypothetical protein